MSAERKSILVVAHGAKLNGDARKVLREAGYIIVRGDPSQFRVVEAVPIGHSGLLLEAAIATIRGEFSFANGEAVRARFASEFLRRAAVKVQP